jgi:predicted O-methyltransferase YrrM
MARTYDISKKQNYIRSLYCKEDDKFHDIFQTANDKKNIQLSPEEGKLLSMLLTIHQSKYVLELGTLIGYSCCWIASSLPKDGKVITLEVDENRHKIAKQNFAKMPFANKITTINDDAIDFLKTLKLDYKLDAVFIDAKKDDYPLYLELVYPFLKAGGLIIADNTLLFGTVFEDSMPKYHKKWQAIKDFNFHLSNQQKYKSLILPTSDGLTVSIKL